MNNVQISFSKASGKYNVSINGNTFSTKKHDYIEYMYKKITGDRKSFDEISASKKAKKSDSFSINERFEFVETLVNMVARGVQSSAVITGEGGLGKTFTVNKTLKAQGLNDISDVVGEVGFATTKRKGYITVKGYSTPKGLFRTLYENKNSVIVFDDCDSILKDPVALNLLKTALDSYGKRIISWNAEGFGRGDDELPRSFEFTGRVIFISNLNQDAIDQAIRSRSMMIDLSMTEDQKIERMATIAKSDDFLPEFTEREKFDALGLIRELKNDAKEISLRTLISVTKIRAAGGDNWKKLASYTLCA